MKTEYHWYVFPTKLEKDALILQLNVCYLETEPLISIGKGFSESEFIRTRCFLFWIETVEEALYRTKYKILQRVRERHKRGREIRRLEKIANGKEV